MAEPWNKALVSKIESWRDSLVEGYADGESSWEECAEWMNTNPKVLSWGAIPFTKYRDNWHDSSSAGYDIQKDILSDMTESFPEMLDPNTLVWTFNVEKPQNMGLIWKDPTDPNIFFRIEVRELKMFLEDLDYTFSKAYDFFHKISQAQVQEDQIEKWSDWLDSSGDFYGSLQVLFGKDDFTAYDEELSEEDNRIQAGERIWIITPMLFEINDLLNWSSEQIRQLWLVLSR